MLQIAHRPSTPSKLVLYCPAVTPPFFDLLSGKRGGGGRNNEDLRFCLAVKPSPHPTNSRTLLCGRRREPFDRHAVAVLKDEELLATYMLQNIAGSLAARLRPPAATAG